MNKIIGLAGEAGCGKDEAGTFLRDVRGYRLDKFALPIYQGLAAMLNCNISNIEEGKRKGLCPEGLDKTYRQLLQTLGTEWGRDMVDYDIWTKLAQKRIQSAQTYSNVNIVFTDVRFNNEAAMILRNGGMVFRIVRPDMQLISESAHVSESGISNEFITDEINNTGTIKQLHGRTFAAIHCKRG